MLPLLLFWVRSVVVASTAGVFVVVAIAVVRIIVVVPVASCETLLINMVFEFYFKCFDSVSFAAFCVPSPHWRQLCICVFCRAISLFFSFCLSWVRVLQCICCFYCCLLFLVPCSALPTAMSPRPEAPPLFEVKLELLDNAIDLVPPFRDEHG